MRLQLNTNQVLSLQQRVSLDIDENIEELKDIVDTFKYHRTHPLLIKEVKNLMIKVNSPENFSETYESGFNFLKDDEIRLEETLKLAAKIHEKETRDSGLPMFFHLVGTGLVSARVGFPTYITLASILHDVIESPNCTEEDIKKMKEIDYNVFLIVNFLSTKKIYDPEEKDKEYYNRLENTSMTYIPPKIIKPIDSLLNLYDINGMKENEFYTAEERKKRFKQKIKTYSLKYAKLVDDLNIIRIKEDDERFSLKDYLQEKLNN